MFQSNENDIYCWEPGALPSDIKLAKIPHDACTKIAKFEIEHCGYYFIRFATDYDQSILAVGNAFGNVRLYDLECRNPMKIPYVTLEHPKRKHIVRDITFSRCGRDLVCCSDDGTIWLYQRKVSSNDV